jgi:hypothetical protein
VKTRLLSLAVGAALLALPASAQAEVYTFGPDIDSSGPATLSENHQADTLFFNQGVGGTGSGSPVAGEVTSVRIKGTIVPRTNKVESDLQRMFHIQVLHPNPDGQYTVETSTQDLFFPIGVSPNTISTYSADAAQCVGVGDYVDFNNVGGWDGDMADPNGTTYKIFGAAPPGGPVNWYERDNGTNIGTTWFPNRRVDNGTGTTYPGAPKADRQLLMQVTVATGYDARPPCGRKGLEYKGITMSTPSPAPKVYDDGIARVRTLCPDNSYGGCNGTLRLEAEGQVLGQADVSLNTAETTNIQLKLTNEAANLLAMRGTLTATATGETHDGFGVALTTTAPVQLTAARPAPTGFAGTTARAQTVTVKKGSKALTIKGTCPAGTIGACTGTLSAVSQKRISISRADKRGKVWPMATGAHTIPAGQTARMPITLSKAGLKVLKAKKVVVAIATVTSVDGAGRSASKRVKLTFKYRGK